MSFFVSFGDCHREILKACEESIRLVFILFTSSRPRNDIIAELPARGVAVRNCRTYSNERSSSKTNRSDSLIPPVALGVRRRILAEIELTLFANEQSDCREQKVMSLIRKALALWRIKCRI